MFAMIFFITAFVALVVVSFKMASSENTGAQKAYNMAKLCVDSHNDLIKQVTDVKTVASAIADVLKNNNIMTEKLKQKIEWLEMKANNQPRQTSQPTTVILKQEAPLKIGVIYKQSKPTKKETSK